MIEWQPDTCNCIILLDEIWQNGIFKHKCKLHQNNTWQEVQEHNKIFNAMPQTTDEQKQACLNAKAQSKAECDL